MLDIILKDIDQSKDELIEGLMQLIRLESSDLKETKAQTFVECKLKELGFDVHTFKGIDDKCLSLADYCPLDTPFHENAYNVIGCYKQPLERPSLLLFAHIDTESENYFGTFSNPYEAYYKDNKIYGLGASDDKGGIAMMLYALSFIKKYYPQLPFDCTVMSILGKHGGAAGTLSALMKGYRADYGIYLHPAETGHGFAEIKNISLGVVDLDIKVFGKPTKPHDDLDTGVNANVLASQIVIWLEEYNQIKRKQYTFDFGSFKDQPSFILNIGSIVSNNGYGGVAQETSIKVRIRFFHPLTITTVYNDIQNYLQNKINETNIMEPTQLQIQKGNFNASPAIVDTNDDFIQMILKNITNITGITDFIHQYHGGSDIRLPILYGNCKCIGIGPSCELPLANSQKREWISVDDYINGIKIITSCLYDFIQK